MNDKLKAALEKEGQSFKEFYLWLEKSMPDLFFKEVEEEWITLIVHALMGFKVQDYFAEIHLRHAAITLCFDSLGADVNILKSYPMHGIKSYTTYVSKEPLPFPDNPGLLRIATIYFTEWGAKDEKEIDQKFLQKLTPEREAVAKKLFQKAQENDECQYETVKENGALHVLLAWKNVPKHNYLYRLARVVYQHNLVMKNALGCYVNPYSKASILMLSFRLQESLKGDISDFLQEISTLKYFDSLDEFDEAFVSTKLLSGNLANFLRSLQNFIHQVLVHADPNLYSLENISEGLTRHPELTQKLCEAFELKFNPSKVNLQKFQEVRGEFYLLVKQLDTGHEFLDERRKNILFQGMNFVEHTLKTNFYCRDKSALSFRLDPKYLEHAPYERKTIFPELPYAVFFFKGMHYMGFHVRFRDLARGGLRTIYPEKKEKVIAERNNVFLECYYLALTQQKKNKDIPEGGAKAVIFLEPDELLEEEALILSHEMEEADFEKEEIRLKVEKYKEEQKLETLYQTQRSYIKAFLSLLNCDPDGKLRTKDIIDYWNRPEYVYLGPDENMHNIMIEWIAEESKRVGYKPGGAFISGKVKTGINHKEYGVTSLGVNVYMHQILLYLGIDPNKDVFTVKMTGGPDGDVAGNEIHNLFRYYPKNAKILALTDVSGTIFDPKGLDLEMCDTLFREAQSIRHYPPEKLNPGGFLLDRLTRKEMTKVAFQTLCYRKTEEGVVEEWLHGNEMNSLLRFNVHKTKADVFLPCGGRPRTLRDSNVGEFLDEMGIPTSRAIVEGANLYLSPWARSFLEEKGVLIIKDSSANKCGVISSSFEILSGLILTDDEFVHFKPQIVSDILARLEKLSYEEARLLIDTHKETKEPLSLISDRISEKINFFTDQLLAYLETAKLDDSLIKCLLNYCLKTLRENFSARIIHDLPEAHKRAMIASHIASRMVYKKGLSWSPSLVEVLPLILNDPDLNLN